MRNPPLGIDSTTVMSSRARGIRLAKLGEAVSLMEQWGRV
jgi:hypothetical protein